MHHSIFEEVILLILSYCSGCCTSCAIRIKSGQIRQPQALGISAELKDKVGYIFMIFLIANLSDSVSQHILCFIDSWSVAFGNTYVIVFTFFTTPKICSRHSSAVIPLMCFQGYALLCVGFPFYDFEVETQEEDEVYWLQFGRYFARGSVERDDYAWKLALVDE
ncbi:hypothetical protein ZIOFF_024215 [Zingiber officinale]|uniref:Uncharacterized protein n=1 Tax=Zingiber officinale TaxID=94328 RepID=A0A8J5GT87_ZINOF|nr:hypothetical protein ZIOFF_024215 [Zingiber officinale]